MKPEEIYDQLAPVYDVRYLSETDHFENDVVTRLTRKTLGLLDSGEVVLDVGCGTGLALELGILGTENFEGLDPSQGMLDQLLKKFPSLSKMTFAGTFEEFIDAADPQDNAYSAVISLFGSCSYISAEYTQRMFELAPKLVLMYYREGYWPDYEDEPVNSVPSREMAVKCTEDLGGKVFYFNNFKVCVVGA